MTRIRLTTGIYSWLWVKQPGVGCPHTKSSGRVGIVAAVSPTHTCAIWDHTSEKPGPEPESQTFTLIAAWITQVLQDKPFSWQTLINSEMGPNSIYENDLLWTYLYTVLFLLNCICWAFLSSLSDTSLFMLYDIFNVFLNSVCSHFVKDLCICLHQEIDPYCFCCYYILIWYRYQDSSLHRMGLVCGFWFYGIVWEGLLSALFSKGGGIQHGILPP